MSAKVAVFIEDEPIASFDNGEIAAKFIEDNAVIFEPLVAKGNEIHAGDYLVLPHNPRVAFWSGERRNILKCL